MSANRSVEVGQLGPVRARWPCAAPAGRPPTGTTGSCGRTRGARRWPSVTSSVMVKKARSSWVDQAPRLDLLGQEAAPAVPVGPAGDVEQDHGRRLGLARLEQGQQLEALVEGAEPAGQHDEAVRLLQEHELAGEEVAHLDQLGVLGDEPVGPLLVGEPDVHPDRLVAPGALHAGGHDARPGPGHHHPPGAGHGGGQRPGLPVGGVVGLGAGRAEDGDLLAVGGSGWNTRKASAISARAVSATFRSMTSVPVRARSATVSSSDR